MITEVGMAIPRHAGSKPPAVAAYASIIVAGWARIGDIRLVPRVGNQDAFGSQRAENILVAFPSHEFKVPCPQCRMSVSVCNRYCPRCGAMHRSEALTAEEKKHAYIDVAHPIDNWSRVACNAALMSVYEKEEKLSQQPGYHHCQAKYSVTWGEWPNPDTMTTTCFHVFSDDSKGKLGRSREFWKPKQ